jgi:hypothetical protein
MSFLFSIPFQQNKFKNSKTDFFGSTPPIIEGLLDLSLLFLMSPGAGFHLFFTMEGGLAFSPQLYI